MDTYNYQEPSKKKWLVPIVVLFVCAAAMTGAAFAYNSTVNGSGDIPDVDYITLDFAEATDGEYDADTLHYKASKALTFNHSKSYDGQKIVETYSADEDVVLFTVKVTATHTSESKTISTPKVTVSSDVIENTYGLTIHVGEGEQIGETLAWTYEITISGDYKGNGVPPITKITDIEVTATMPQELTE